MCKDAPTKKNWRGKVSHGFRFWFSLLDKSHRPTRSDGRLTIKVTRRVIGAFISRRAFVYKATIEVHKEKFQQSKNDPNFLGFIFNIEEPILKEGEWLYNIELWFKTPDGLELYGTDRR